VSVKKAVLPGYDVPVVDAGGRMTPAWYEFFSNLLRRGVLDMPDVDNSTPISSGQVLEWSGTGTAGKFKPSAN
jgi:hypothetical protein